MRLSHPGMILYVALDKITLDVPVFAVHYVAREDLQLANMFPFLSNELLKLTGRFLSSFH